MSRSPHLRLKPLLRPRLLLTTSSEAWAVSSLALASVSAAGAFVSSALVHAAAVRCTGRERGPRQSDDAEHSHTATFRHRFPPNGIWIPHVAAARIPPRRHYDGRPSFGVPSPVCPEKHRGAGEFACPPVERQRGLPVQARGLAAFGVADRDDVVAGKARCVCVLRVDDEAGVERRSRIPSCVRASTRWCRRLSDTPSWSGRSMGRRCYRASDCTPCRARRSHAGRTRRCRAAGMRQTTKADCRHSCGTDSRCCTDAGCTRSPMPRPAQPTAWLSV